MRRALVAVTMAALALCAACGGSDAPASTGGGGERPADAVRVVDANGQEVGWFTADESSGAPWVDVVRSEATSVVPALAGGLQGTVVTTTLDAARQRELEAALDVVPDTGGRFAVSAVAVDVGDAGIVAVADTAPGSDLSIIQRPTGSALKFVILAAAVRAGVQPDDVLDGGLRCAIPTATGIEVFEGDAQYALVDVATATAFSVNCAFAKLYAMAGGERVLGLAHELGLSAVRVDSPAVAIGAAQESPREMVGAMAAVLGDGTFEPPFVVESVVDGTGATMYRHESRRRPVLTATQADTIASLLTGVVDIGTATVGQLDGGRPFAAKTGTQEDNTDAWLVGGTPSLAISVWMGNPANAADQMVLVDGFDVPKVQGGTYPARVAKAFLDAASTGSASESWPAPTPDRAAGRLLLNGLECAPAARSVDGDDATLSITALDDQVTPC